jgi:hypothetical protein
MDPSMIANSVISILAPYLAKTGEEVAKKFGSAAWDKVVELHQTIKDRFAKEKDTYPSQTLKRFEQKPEARKESMKEALIEMLKQDQAFAAQLEELLNDTMQASAQTTFTTTVLNSNVDNIYNINQLEGGLNIDRQIDDTGKRKNRKR